MNETTTGKKRSSSAIQDDDFLEDANVETNDGIDVAVVADIYGGTSGSKTGNTIVKNQTAGGQEKKCKKTITIVIE